MLWKILKWIIGIPVEHTNLNILTSVVKDTNLDHGRNNFYVWYDGVG